MNKNPVHIRKPCVFDREFNNGFRKILDKQVNPVHSNDNNEIKKASAQVFSDMRKKWFIIEIKRQIFNMKRLPFINFFKLQ